MSSSLAQRAGLSVPIPLMTHQVIENQGGVLDRMMALAAYARLLDPSLGANLRAIRHVPDGDSPRDIPFKVMFTADTRAVLPHGVVEDMGAQEYWDVMDRVLPAGMAQAERANFAMSVQATGKPAFDVGLEEGYRRGLVSLETFERSKPEGSRVYTHPMALNEDQCMAYQDLATRAFITPPLSATMETSLGRQINHFQSACNILSQPFEKASVNDRTQLAAHISALDNSQAEGTFEENHRHGWAGYAMANGGASWTGYLLNQVGVSPHAPYGQISPITMAVGIDHAGATNALLDADVSPNIVLRGWPPMFARKAQESLQNNTPTHFLPLTAFAAAVSSNNALGALLKRGGEANFASEGQNTPAHWSCKNANEAAVRLLHQHQADFTQKNAQQHVPDELIPADAMFNSLHAFVKQIHDKQAGVTQATPVPAATLGQRARALAGVKDDEQSGLEALWTAPSPGKPRRSRSNP